MTKRESLGWLALGALALIFVLARPFATGLLLGALVAFTLEPLYEALVRRTGRPLAASSVTVVGAGVLIIGLVAGFLSLFVVRAMSLAIVVRDQMRNQGVLYGWVQSIAGRLGHFGISAASVTQRLEAGAGELASRLAGMAGAIASGTFEALLELLFALLSMYAILRYWKQIVVAVARVSPLEPSHTQSLLAEFRRVGRLTVTGTVVTGLAQGALATIGYLLTDVPQAVFFGVCTALASLIPAVGTLLIWIPIGAYLFLSGHPARAIIELTWGTLIIVGFSDYVLRPRMASDAAMPAVLVFIALFGGIDAFGISGLVIGPVVMSLAVAVLRLYAQERDHSRAGRAS